MERNLAQISVLVAEDHKTIKGYYTLSSSSVALSELP